jgi:hypothetical protein
MLRDTGGVLEEGESSSDEREVVREGDIELFVMVFAHLQQEMPSEGDHDVDIICGTPTRLA